FTSIANADVPPETQHEVQHLLNFVTNTSCQIVRNGSAYYGAKAIKHIKKKYNYYRDDIRTTEQFIEYSATKSTMSGKYYLVKCGSQNPVKTRDWLLQELKKYRVKQSSRAGVDSY
ncbi:MAG: DUF5329 family protein, partial [Thiotrichaceae bacterium]|nr:DUF5329 family protein [Thiotrichaceae bacterium]